MTPSVGPSISSRRRQSRPMSTRPFSVSSTTGAPKVAATYSPVDAPSAGMVTYSRLAVLISSAASAAMPAPQPNANTRLMRGSGSSRSTHSTAAISSGTGSRASGSAIANGAAPAPTANDCATSIPSATIAQVAVTAVPMMSATGVRPGGRPARTARGSNGAPAGGAESYMGGSLTGPAPRPAGARSG